MKIYKAILFLAVIFATLLQSCEDSVDNDNSFLYLPQYIAVKDSTVSYIQVYTYNNQNRIDNIVTAGINLKSTNDTIYTLTNFAYDAEGNPTQTITTIQTVEGGSITDQYSASRIFTYNGSTVSITTKEGNETLSIINVELNDKKQMTKKSVSGTNESISYEYDSKGNLVKTTDQDNTVSEYSYDSRRGIFREVNIPQWYITAIISTPISNRWATINEINNIHNNCTFIKTSGATIEASSNTYSYTYGGFDYPTTISDNNSTQAVIRYIGFQ